MALSEANGTLGGMAIEYRTGGDGTVRPGLVGGPDVREIVAAVEDARRADPTCDPGAVVVQATGVTAEQVAEALAFIDLDLRSQFKAEGRVRWSEADGDGVVTVHWAEAQEPRGPLEQVLDAVADGTAQPHRPPRTRSRQEPDEERP